MTNVYSFKAIDGSSDQEAFVRQNIVNSTYTSLTNGAQGLKNFPVFLAECFEHAVWRHERILAGGSKCGPISFHEFIHAPYPTGLDATYDTIRPLIEAPPHRELLKLWDEATQRSPGNPTGVNQYKKAEAGTLYNVQDTYEPSAPTGNTAQAGIRRLRKAAEAGDDRAQVQLQGVLDGRLSVNAACISMGWRKPTVTVRDEPVALFEAAARKTGALEMAKRAWFKMSIEEQEEFLEWASRNMTTVFQMREEQRL